MKKWCVVFVISALCLKGFAENNSSALERLKAGNRVFVQQHPAAVFENSVSAQVPFAAILSCADSRVPPEQIFNQGIGDLFVVRVAGNVATPAVVDSVVFAADTLKASLIVVLGHQNCGAVNAVVTQSPSMFDLPNIVPYIEIGEKDPSKGYHLEKAIKANVLEQVKYLKLHPTLSRLIASGKLAIVGAFYYLETGEVEFL